MILKRIMPSQFSRRRVRIHSGKPAKVQSPLTARLTEGSLCRQEERKVNLVWHEDASISYNRQKRWYFEPDMSTGSLQDTVNTLNVPMVTAVDYARDDFIMVKSNNSFRNAFGC